MKLLLSADTHGKKIDIKENYDLILIAGDFSDGDKLRNAIFGKGDIEEAKKEIFNSAERFIECLPKGIPSVACLGNVEEPIKENIICLLKKYNIHHKNGVIEVNGLKILIIDFFVEKWWAEKFKPDNPDTMKRAIRDEENLKRIIEKIENIDIIISHIPPFGILDINPNPPAFLPKIYKGNMGSKILRDLIEKKQPLLVVCGHIHIPGRAEIGKTIIINPGEKEPFSL